MSTERVPPAGSASGLRFRVLGPLEVSRGDVALDLGPPKQRAVLAALVLGGGRVVSTDRLIEAVWGDDPPPRALSNLQVYVSRLRSLLQDDGVPGLIRRSPGYALPQVWVDAAEFRRLIGQAAERVRLRAWSAAVDEASEAIRLWRGPFLEDLGDEPWVRTEAVQLDELYAQGLESWVTGLLGLGQIGEAITRTQTVTEANPLREHGWWLRMMTLHRAGRTPDALEAFQRFAGELDEQLGLEPGPPLRELQTAILRHDPAIAMWPNRPGDEVPSPPSIPPTTVPWAGAETEQAGQTAAPATSAASRVTSAAPRVLTTGPPPIVGREQELRTLATVLDEVLAGACRWVVLTGRAGMGKTRLAMELAGRARDFGATVAWTSCPDDGGVPAWWPLRTVVSALGHDPDEVFRPPAGVDADTVRFVVYDRLSQLLDAATADDHPVLLVIDDAQWLDATSIRGLVYLAHTQRLHGVGILLTVRDREHRPEFDQAVAAIGREETAVHIPIEPLTAPDASALLRQVAGDTITAADAFALMRRIGGNPLLLTEYARLPLQDRREGQMPLAARGLLERRLRRLPDSVLTVLGAAGIIGETFELDLLAIVAGMDLFQLADRLDAAAGEGIVRPAASGIGYQFHHALVRDAVIAQLTVLRRQTVHARIAEALAGRGDDPRTLIRRATHLSAAMPIVGPTAVIEAASAAARAASDSWDWDSAAEQWASAIAAHRAVIGADPRFADDLLLERLDALSRVGRAQLVWDEMGTALDDAIAAVRPATIGRLAHALVRSGGYWPFVAFGSDARPLVRRIAAALPVARADPAAHARVLTALAVGSSYEPDQADVDRTSQQAVEIAEEVDDADLLADTLVGRLTFLAATRAHSPDYLWALDRLHGLPHDDAAIDVVLEQCHRIRYATFSGDVEDIAERLRTGVAAADRLRLAGSRLYFRWVEAMIAHWQGGLDEAEALAATAYETHEQFEPRSADVAYLAPRLLIWWDRGTLSDHPAEIAASPDPLLWGALAAAERGELAAGRHLLMSRLEPNGPELWHTMPSYALLAHAVADLGLVEAAAPALDWLRPRAGLFAALSPFGAVGPVSLSTGRLWALIGAEHRARADLSAAEQMSRNSDHSAGRIRSRLAQLALDPLGEGRTQALRELAAEATARGMAGLARRASQAL